MKKTVSFAMAVVTVLYASLFCLVSTSCGDENTLVVCNWGEYISDGTDGYMDVIAEFENQTGIRVEYVTAETTEALYSLMKSGSVSYDVIFPSDYMAEKMIAEDMLAPLNFDNIPNIKNILPEFMNLDYDPENLYTAPYFWGTVGLIYNEELINKEDLPLLEDCKDWSLLWSDRPEYKNKIMMFNNPRDAFGIAELQLGYSLNTHDEAELRAAAELLKQQKFCYYMDEFFELMPSGGLAMAPYYAGDYLYVASENEHLKFVIPECGTNLFNDVMCIPKTSKHKDLAEKFINFMLDPEVGRNNTEYLGYSTPNGKVLEIMDEEMRQDPVAYPEPKKEWERYRDLGDETTEFMRDLWINVLGNN